MNKEILTKNKSLANKENEMTKPCHCPAYNFPHRFGGGKCVGVESAPKCTNCGKECSIYESTESTPYEFWGERGYHTEHYSGSDCCDAEVFYAPMGMEYA